MTDDYNPAGRTPQQRHDRATPWRRDEQMETLLKMRQTDPSGYRALGPRVDVMLGLYEAARDVHASIPGDAA